MTFKCPDCGNTDIEITKDGHYSNLYCPKCKNRGRVINNK